MARALDAAGLAAEDIGVRRPILDEVFLRITGRAAAPADVRADQRPERIEVPA